MKGVEVAFLFLLTFVKLRGSYGLVCKSDVDVAVLLDSSVFIDKGLESTYLSILRNLLNQFQERSQNVRLCVVSYGLQPKMLLNFGEPLHLILPSKTDCSDKKVMLAPALTFLRNNVFANSAGHRTNAHKLVYLLAHKNVDDTNFLDVTKEADILRVNGVNIVPVMVNKKACIDDLSKLSNPRTFQTSCCYQEIVPPVELMTYACPPSTLETTLTTTPFALARTEIVDVGGSISALPGRTGKTGATGHTGEQGPIGPAGSLGLRGDIGHTGVMGPPGPAGADGMLGHTGYTGHTGKSGSDGLVGAAGPHGWTGDRGQQGDTGSAGKSGPVGAPGPQGLPGNTGEQGPFGSTGFTGPEGVPGLKGDIGYTGPKGDQGLTGYTGPQGPKGDIGHTGPFGEVGLKGDTGEHGPQGHGGYTGHTGQSGSEGIMGPAGIPGLPGPCGPSGQRGSDGSPGYTGSTGSTGPAGPPGRQGLPGAGFNMNPVNNCGCKNESLCFVSNGVTYCLQPSLGCNLNNAGCQQLCKDYSTGPICSCVAGFELSPDKKACLDLNECSLNPRLCSSNTLCINTYGSYVCLQTNPYGPTGNSSKADDYFQESTKFDWKFFLLVSVVISYVAISIIAIWSFVHSHNDDHKRQKMSRIIRDMALELASLRNVSKL